MLVMMNMVYMAIVTGRMMVGGASGGRRRGATPGKWSGDGAGSTLLKRPRRHPGVYSPLHYDASSVENGKLRNLPKLLPHPSFLRL